MSTANLLSSRDTEQDGDESHHFGLQNFIYSYRALVQRGYREAALITEDFSSVLLCQSWVKRDEPRSVVKTKQPRVHSTKPNPCNRS